MKKPSPLADDLHLLKQKASEASAYGSESESESESIFGPLNLFIFGYVKGGVLGNNNIGIKKCTTTFLWVLNLGQVGGRRKFFQNLTTGMIFSKMVSNLSVLEGIFETKFQGRFFFEKILKGFLL